MTHFFPYCMYHSVRSHNGPSSSIVRNREERNPTSNSIETRETLHSSAFVCLNAFKSGNGKCRVRFNQVPLVCIMQTVLLLFAECEAYLKRHSSLYIGCRRGTMARTSEKWHLKNLKIKCVCDRKNNNNAIDVWRDVVAKWASVRETEKSVWRVWFLMKTNRQTMAPLRWCKHRLVVDNKKAMRTRKKEKKKSSFRIQSAPESEMALPV